MQVGNDLSRVCESICSCNNFWTFWPSNRNFGMHADLYNISFTFKRQVKAESEEWDKIYAIWLFLCLFDKCSNK